jgi:hypothetical protein
MLGPELVTMSMKEVDRLEVLRRVLERGLTRVKAAGLLGISPRQVRRLCGLYVAQGATGLVSKRRGKPSNRQLPADFRARVVDLILDRYADFGPTLAREKLIEVHGLRVGKETLRRWMAAAGVWLPRDQRIPRPHQPRYRRECLGELVQIDGCQHRWFEDRGAPCSLLVYVDDATGKLMEMRFEQTESAFGYFEATKTYLRRHGKPVAFYSDKHSIFRVAKEGTMGRDGGVTQFGRALGELNIDIICANSPQAKGRVERMNQTLQDRLVKELRLRGISSIEEGNAFASEFMEDFNRRFARPARNPHDAHRPVGVHDLDLVFVWKEERTLSRNLVVHYKRVSYLIQPTAETLGLGRRRVSIYERQDGRIAIYCARQLLPYSALDKQPHVDPGEVVENKRLGAALAIIQQAQTRRDEIRLASPKLTLLQKDRLRAKRESLAATATPAETVKRKPGRPPKTAAKPSRIVLAGVDPNGPVQAYFDRFAIEQAERRRQQNAKTNERKRQREFAAAQARAQPDLTLGRQEGSRPPEPAWRLRPARPLSPDPDISIEPETGHF